MQCYKRVIVLFLLTVGFIFTADKSFGALNESGACGYFSDNEIDSNLSLNEISHLILIDRGLLLSAQHLSDFALAIVGGDFAFSDVSAQVNAVKYLLAHPNTPDSALAIVEIVTPILMKTVRRPAPTAHTANNLSVISGFFYQVAEHPNRGPLASAALKRLANNHSFWAPHVPMRIAQKYGL